MLLFLLDKFVGVLVAFPLIMLFCYGVIKKIYKEMVMVLFVIAY